LHAQTPYALTGKAVFMFTVKWIVHRYETQPVDVESSVLEDLNAVVSSCQQRLPTMREKHPQTPPDGFLVFDSNGDEVRRWFGSVRPHAGRQTAEAWPLASPEFFSTSAKARQAIVVKEPPDAIECRDEEE
jgi:hypothetical protein